MEDFVFESAQYILALVWSYLTALSNFFLVLQIKKLVYKKCERTLCDLGLSALSADIFQLLFLQKPLGFVQYVMVFPAEKQLTGLSSEKYFRYYELVFPLLDFFKSFQKCYLEH